jgi:hypothetical protein
MPDLRCGFRVLDFELLIVLNEVLRFRIYLTAKISLGLGISSCLLSVSEFQFDRSDVAIIANC